MIHILHVLMCGYAHIHNPHHLLRFYLHHHAIRFLLSGYTSESPASRTQAHQLLIWLTGHRVAPVDW